MSKADAKAYLAKAEEFLAAARANLAEGWTNAAASNAVSCGINAKDAICLAQTGRTTKTDNHAEAIKELRQAGKAGADLESTFSRLLKLKPKAQYQRDAVSVADAEKAVEWAQRMCDGALQVVTA